MEKLAVFRYKNRKYYSPTIRDYVKLDELFAAVKTGIKVKVVEKETGNDITKETLIKALQQNFMAY